MNTVKIEATSQNVENAIASIKKFAEEKGFQIIGDIEQRSWQLLKFESKSQEKVLRNYLTKLDKKPGIALINRMLHFLYKKIYKLETAPQIEYSEKELKIKAARKAWRKSLAETEALMKAYKEEKGNFYKK